MGGRKGSGREEREVSSFRGTIQSAPPPLHRSHQLPQCLPPLITLHYITLCSITIMHDITGHDSLSFLMGSLGFLSLQYAYARVH